MRYFYPKDSQEAKYSIPFITAVALLDGEITLKQFTDERTQDSKVREIISKIRLYNHPDLPASPDPTKMSAAQLSKTFITIRVTSGEEYSQWAESAKGYVDKPLSEEEILKRYRSFTSLVLSHHAVEKTIKIIESLEKIGDIEELMNILRGG
jgi:2-methylcitrate dehydratase PrpD